MGKAHKMMTPEKSGRSSNSALQAGGLRSIEPRLRALVVSNMYPSRSSPAFGVFVRRITDQMESEGIVVHRTVRTGAGGKMMSYAWFYVKTFFAVLFTKADVIYMHFATHSYPPVALARCLRAVPLAVHVHGGDIIPDGGSSSTLRNRVLSRIAESALAHASLIVAPSRYFAREVEMRHPSTNGKLFVSPSGGVDPAAFPFAPVTTHRPLHLVFLGRLMSGKGVDYIIPALRLARARNPERELVFTFAGDGPSRGMLEEQASEAAGVDIRFTGMLDPKQIPELIHSCHALVFPSFRAGESLGLVALESMSCGRPVIAARSGAMEDIVIDGKNGFLFEPADSLSLSLAIDGFLQLDEVSLSTLSHEAKATADQFSPVVVGRALYDRLLRFSPDVRGASRL